MFRIKYLVGALLAAAFVIPAAAANAETKHRKSQQSEDVIYLSKINREVPEKFKRHVVRLSTNERPGTIIVDTNNKFLYYVLDGSSAIRYGIGVGREGFGWSGVVKVARKAEWPDWVPPKEMIAREAKKGHYLPARMDGGKDNPLGARALYLFGKGGDSGYRIHGTNQPWSIGLNLSSGCIRMMNEDVTDLYKRAPVGTKVIVIGPGNRQGNIVLEDRGTDILKTLFTALGG
ncbi:MAG TPA: L,D-transpeptidase [Ensifer sp.]|nr:L,D-transpeptidase [Ensifer sp.]